MEEGVGIGKIFQPQGYQTQMNPSSHFIRLVVQVLVKHMRDIIETQAFVH